MTEKPIRASEATPRRDGEPPVELHRFRALMREGGVEEIVESALAVYRHEASGRLERLTAAMGQADARSIEAEAHALKSSSLNIWAVRLAAFLEEAETAAVSGDVRHAQSMMGPIRAELGRVVDYLDGVIPAVP
jgi:HPt (histidine-containing phosphotransfer) domain-containing protein